MIARKKAVTRLTLDLSHPDVQKSFGVTIGDRLRVLEITLVDAGRPFSLPPTYSAMLTGIKPDGTELLNHCIVEDGRIVYDFEAGNEIATCVGAYAVTVWIVDAEGDSVATPKVWVNVTDNPAGRIIESNDQFTVLQELTASVNQMDKAIDDLVAKADHLEIVHKTIPVNAWLPTNPPAAYISHSSKIVSATDSYCILLVPADNRTAEESQRAELAVAYNYDSAGLITISVSLNGAAPETDLQYAMIVLTMPVDAKAVADDDEEEGPTRLAAATFVGVANLTDEYMDREVRASLDRLGVSGGGGGSGGVSEAVVEQIVSRLVPEWARNASKPSYGKDEVGLGNVANERQYSAGNPPPYPVTSVNGMSGAVSLDAANVGARPSNWMPTAEQVGARPNTWTPTAEQVGARPNTWTPSAADVGARPADWMPSATDVGADPKGTASSAVSTHNVSDAAHNDIRQLIVGISNRLNALFNSTDTTLDDFAEIVAYIKSNKSLIDNITSSKVSVVDIINNLTTNVTNKPLSAAQGVEIKGMIDNLDGTKVSNTDVVNNLTNSSTTKPLSAAQGKVLKGLIDDLTSDKLDASSLESAINTALAQAKASGAFDGAPGANGTSVTVKSVTESTADGGSNVVTFSDGKTVTIKNGTKGSKGDAYTMTSTDKTNIANLVKSLLNKDTWTFTKKDGTTETKVVYVE